MRLAIIGATGLVGSAMINILEERNFPCDELILAASPRSKGKKLTYKEKEIGVETIEEAIQKKPDIAIFSAGGSTSLKYAPLFANVGTKVIDNSSAWRMQEDKKLIVPEVNADILTKDDMIIANPNCSTIQLVVSLAPLHKKYKIRRLVISTYQSVTGSGIKAVKQLKNERKGISGEIAYPHHIDLNCIPHGGSFDESGYTTEEIKLVNETRKILNDHSLNITATVVRIPVFGGHSESVNVEFDNDYQLDDLLMVLKNQSGITIMDDPQNNEYPMPFYSQGKDDVFIGRIRRDESQPKSLNMWIVSDNLRKGAATNAIQIAEYLIKNNLIG